MARPDCYEILRHAAYGSFVGPLPEALERHLRWLAGWDTDTVAAAAALFVSAYMTGMRTGMAIRIPPPGYEVVDPDAFPGDPILGGTVELSVSR